VLCGSAILSSYYTSPTTATTTTTTTDIMISNPRDDARRTMIDSMLQDSFVCLSVLREDVHMSFSKASIKLSSYIHLLSPAIEWMIYNVGVNASREQFQAVLQLYRQYSNESMVLKHIIDAFDPSYYSHGSIGMAALIKQSQPSIVSIVDVFASLGKKLLVSPPPEGRYA